MNCSFGHSDKCNFNAGLELLHVDEIFLHCKRDSQLPHIAHYRDSKTLQSIQSNNQIGGNLLEKLVGNFVDSILQKFWEVSDFFT